MTEGTYGTQRGRARREPRPFEDFDWTAANAVEADEIIHRYPPGRQHSAIMPLLFLAQRQVGAMTGTQGWLPIPVIEFVARQIDMPYIRAYEVVTFYSMYNREPVGRFHVQVCGTTPCWLSGSDEVFRACADRGMKKGSTTADGLFTLTEVECMGNCANAPMMQVNDDNYEDLTYETASAVLDALARGETPKPGSQSGRQFSAPAGGPTTLTAMASENHDYRPEWGVRSDAG